MSASSWSEISFLRPAFVEDAVWQRILTNFYANVTNPIEDLPAALDDDKNRLVALGIAEPSAMQALMFDIEQAGDFGSLAYRGALGVMGQGWSSIADIKLISNGDVKTVLGLLNGEMLSALDARMTAQYVISLPLAIAVDQDGEYITDISKKPLFTPDQGQSVGYILNAISGGYEISTINGEKYLFDHDGILLTFTSSTGQEIVVTYDVNDRISRYEDNLGNYIEFTYDVTGKISNIVDANGHIVTLDYDPNDLLGKVESDSRETDYTYDTNGNLLTIETAAGREIVLTYDAEGKVSSRSENALITENYTYDNAGAITVTNSLSEASILQIGPGGLIVSTENNASDSYIVSFNALTKTVTLEDPNNIETEFSFDNDGRLLSITDGNESTISFEYEASSGRLVTFTDAEGGIREFTYDDVGRLLTSTWGDETFREYSYNLDGLVSEIQNRRGQIVEYEYDARGRVTDISDSASGAIEYGYDARGNVETIHSSAGLTTITYDAADRITLIEYSNGRSLAYTYDSDGKRLSMVNQDTEGTFYTYDAAGRLDTISDDNGLLVNYDYDAAGRLMLEAKGNGSYTEYSYNGNGLIEDIKNYDSGSAVTSSFSYTYDHVGKVTSIVTNNGTWIYDYDNAGQLIEADFSSTNMSIASVNLVYQYDSAGNRLATIENSVSTSYVTNEMNQYESVGGKTFSYDDDGNLIAQTATSNSYSYVYDIDNRLIQVTKPDTTVIIYEYDSFGNRSAVVDNGVRTEFLVDPFGSGNIVGEYDELGAKIASYTHGLGLVSRTNAIGDFAYFDIDATGSVVGVTDNSGALANSYVYTPFGDELYESETITNSFEFNGSVGVMEDADNLLYMRARSYDVELGRFLSEDPLYWSTPILESVF